MNVFNDKGQLQNSGRMSDTFALSPFLGWNEVHGGSMGRNFSRDKKITGHLDARKGGVQAPRTNGPNQMGRHGEADRCSRVLQEAHKPLICASAHLSAYCMQTGGHADGFVEHQHV